MTIILLLSGLILTTSCTSIMKESNSVALFDDFSSDKINEKVWKKANRQWGGKDANGGVVPENITFKNGKLYIEAHGDLYNGPVKGVKRFGGKYVSLEHGCRVGGCLVTKQRFASGRYEVRAKIVQTLGACSAFWTFYYNYNNGKIINHEIDIEVPGRPSEKLKNIGFDYALCNNWIGEKGKEYTTGYTKLPFPLNDNKFHTYRFDWHTGSKKIKPKVDFYIDNKKVRTLTTHVPNIAGNFWVGVWFPNKWAGKPDFDTETMVIDWIKITPFNEPNDKNKP